jgi:hypothetical protein
MCQKYPGDPDSPESKEGTAAHWVMAQYLGLTPEQRANRPGIGTLAPNGVPVTDEMIEGAEMFVEAVGDAVDHIEEVLPASLDIHPDNWGTPDAWGYKAVPIPDTAIVGGLITLADYKFGHRHVDVFENWQLVDYAKLVIDKLGLDGLQEQYTRINFVIVQPRNYHAEGPVRTWSCMASDLRAAWNKIRAAIIAAQAEDAPFATGPACRDCTARAHCTALQRAALAAVDEAGRMTPMELPPAAVGLELRIMQAALERLKARVSGLEEVALATVRAGKIVPGFRIETGKGRERWTVPVEQLAAMGDVMGLKVTKLQPVTPKQAIKAGLPAEVVAGFSETPPGETKLVPDDGSLARRTFGGS